MLKSVQVTTTWLSTVNSWIHINYKIAFLTVCILGFVQVVVAIESGNLAVRSLPRGTRIGEKRKHRAIYGWCAGFLVLFTVLLAYLNDKNQYAADQKAARLEVAVSQLSAGLTKLSIAAVSSDKPPITKLNADFMREIERLQKIATDVLTSQHPQRPATTPTTPPSTMATPPPAPPPVVGPQALTPQATQQSPNGQSPEKLQAMKDMQLVAALKAMDSPVRSIVRNIVHRPAIFPPGTSHDIPENDLKALQKALDERTKQFMDILPRTA